jgi:hypothetical protein
VRVVACVPFYGDDERRKENMKFVCDYIVDETELPAYIGEDPHGPNESRNAAIRTAAIATSGQWDIAVLWDADTIAHPDAVRQAVLHAGEYNTMTLAADSHMYMSDASSRRILDGDKYWFAKPYNVSRPRPGVEGRNPEIYDACYPRPCSGVYAITRDLYEAMGGFPEVGEWGYEDLISFQLAGIYGNGVTWTPEHIQLHLWHPAPPRTHPSNDQQRERVRNQDLWHALAQAKTRPNTQDQARNLLKGVVGHVVP